MIEPPNSVILLCGAVAGSVKKQKGRMNRPSREGGNPEELPQKDWIPAFAHAGQLKAFSYHEEHEGHEDVI